MNLKTLESQAAKVFSMTEEEAATWYKKQGITVIYHLGNYWKQTRFGFYEPIHFMARLSSKQAKCPAQIYWGFRASLCEDDAAKANASIPVHLLSDVRSYDLHSLPSKRRFHIRKALNLVQFVELQNSELLKQQGYEVFCSAATRIGATIYSKQEYLSSLENYIEPKYRFAIAGLIDGKLAGYLVGCAINNTAYTEHVYIATEALSSSIGNGLIFEFVQACRRSGEIEQIIYGYHTPSNPSLGSFKEAMGFPITHIPAKVWINPIAKAFIRRRYRNTDVEYILTGNNPVSAQAENKPKL